MYCREQSLVKRVNNTHTIHALKCRCWHCEHCAPERQKDLKGLARRGNPTRFITLTVHPVEGESANQRALSLYRAFKLLRDRAKKAKGWRCFPFLAIFEKTKRGEPHLHILARIPYLDHKWLSDQMKDLIGAPIVDIKHITDKGRVAAYVAKYIAKNPEKWEGCKRYWRSQDYELPENKYQKPEEDLYATWLRSTLHPSTLLRMAAAEGATITAIGQKFIIHGWTGPP